MKESYNYKDKGRHSNTFEYKKFIREMSEKNTLLINNVILIL